jgi:HPt (histidine-containing phosphotransfer) domain-containing protein
MKASSINEIKKELRLLDADALQELCMRLAKYKKENKELLSYLLFEAHDEQAYVGNIKAEIELLFKSLPHNNVYYVKKYLRKILRYANRQIKYSSVKQTEVEIRIFFCQQIKEANVPLHQGTVLYNLYQQQLNKINTVINKLPEDVQFDFENDMATLNLNRPFKV